MAEPICQTCYFSSLTPDERRRAASESLTSTVHMCAEHQAAWDEITASVLRSMFLPKE